MVSEGSTGGHRGRLVGGGARGRIRRVAGCAYTFGYGTRSDDLPRGLSALEENFRDSKSIALGMGLEVSHSRSALRLQALLLIGTLAAFLLWHIGQLAEAEGLHRRYQATTRARRELSIVWLGKLLYLLDLQPLSELAMQSFHGHLGLHV